MLKLRNLYIKTVVAENHIQAWCFSFWLSYFATVKLFSTHIKQRRAKFLPLMSNLE